MVSLLSRSRWIAWAAAAWLCTVPAAAAAEGWAQMAYEPVALGWSAAEVERATAGNMSAIVEQASRKGQLGCERHCARLERIFKRLVVLARLQTARAGTLRWSLTVVRNDDVEAMALPGGQVLISEAFIEARGMRDEALAFVLAHEMAHSILEHERQTLHYARMLLPRDVPRTVADMYVEIDYNLGLLKSLEPVMQQGELEADELGLLLASAAGYAPRQQLDFVRHEAARAEPRVMVVRTHPSAQTRLAQLRLRLPLAERLFETARTRNKGR